MTRRSDNNGGTPTKDFSGRIAAVTGGGSGMGRELVRQLVAEGCAVAICDVSARGMAETQQPVLDRADRLPDTYSRPFQVDNGASLAPF